MLIQEFMLVAVTAFGAWTDVRTGKIPNALTYPMWVFGWVYAGLLGGRAGLVDSVSGFLLAFMPCFVLYLMGGLGGGDVKMLAAVGALMGLRFTASALLGAIFVGALIAILIVVWEGRIAATGRYLWRRLTGFGPRAGLDVETLDVETQVPFGVAICLGCLVALVESRHGWQPVGTILTAWTGTP